MRTEEELKTEAARLLHSMTATPPDDLDVIMIVINRAGTAVPAIGAVSTCEPARFDDVAFAKLSGLPAAELRALKQRWEAGRGPVH